MKQAKSSSWVGKTDTLCDLVSREQILDLLGGQLWGNPIRCCTAKLGNADVVSEYITDILTFSFFNDVKHRRFVTLPSKPVYCWNKLLLKHVISGRPH